MSTDRAIHDLLDRAVQGVSPSTVDPEQAVLTRARRERRRAVLLTAVATLVVVLGGAGALTVVDTQTRGDGPAAGPGGRSAAWTAGQPDDALGREEAQRAAALAEREAALAAAQALVAAGQLSVAFTDPTLVVAPPGWQVQAAPQADYTPSDLLCSLEPNTIYQATIGEGGGTNRPCLGQPIAPYIWDTTSGRLPRIDRPVEQQLVAGIPRWTQSTEADGVPAIDVFFPTVGQSARAVGLSREELLTFLQPVGSTSVGALLAADTDGLNVRASAGAAHVTQVATDDAATLLAQLRQLTPVDPSSARTCFGSQPGDEVDRQYRIQLRSGLSPVGVVVVDVPAAGCAAAVSTFGAMARITPALLTTLERITG